MRYYRIEIDGGTVFTSHDERGQNDRGALQVELDIPVAAFASPGNAGAFVKVWGIPLSMISQSKNLTRKRIKVFGGFKQGLPLAKPRQSGLLVQGWIYQAFGNWQGTDMSLDLVIQAGPPPADDKPLDNPRSISFIWMKGQNLGEAIKNALSPAFQGYTVNANVSSKLTALETQTGAYDLLSAFARWVNQVSKALIKDPNYSGVDITITGNTINVIDNSAPPRSGTKQIAFDDLIGQPTWIEAPSIAFKTMMRADLKIGDEVMMPKTLITNSQQAMSSLINQKAAQQGTFILSSMHHIGNYKQPDGYSWVTEFNAFPKQIQTAT
ncbi:hypothetical protein AC629_24880 [Bradyrhizobium sp. NAS80.1]|uniref:hypothetical protein n=1 Tax=Bradyrhizobium sp. NAS80.1 TaxID=1680159 RepID=UPI00095D291D|nr:hypothetical protein [Bradyrhizobium sp. NAS80.1]OKO81932.1 hypothetical protein AC629_24880 [Bradyrhizobium sp. NAS80.1]